jgi:hypothetical protein
MRPSMCAMAPARARRYQDRRCSGGERCPERISRQLMMHSTVFRAPPRRSIGRRCSCPELNRQGGHLMAKCMATEFSPGFTHGHTSESCWVGGLRGAQPSKHSVQFNECGTASAPCTAASPQYMVCTRVGAQQAYSSCLSLPSEQSCTVVDMHYLCWLQPPPGAWHCSHCNAYWLDEGLHG